MGMTEQDGEGSVHLSLGGLQVRAKNEGQETTCTGHNACWGAGDCFVLLEILKNQLASWKV